MTARRPRRSLVAALSGFAVAISGLAAGSAPAQADVSTKVSSFPYTQDWSDGALIATDDDWSGVLGVEGYRGDNLTGATGTDPQGITADGNAVPDVNADEAVTATVGGVLEIDGQTIAMQGSGTADAPNLVFHLDLTGRSTMRFSFDAQDLDAGADDAVQQIAVQYRVGSIGDYTNLPDGFVPDATTAGSATQVTSSAVVLPPATDGQADVYVRVITTNAVGSDELVGIDDISIAPNAGPPPVTVTDPADVAANVGTAIPDIALAAAGGTPPYTWEVGGLPPGLTETSDGVVGGIPTTAGVYPVTVTATDSATPTPATDSEQFTIVVSPPAGELTPIATIQGTGAASPLAGTTVTTEGVVTARYPTGGLNGIFIQTGGSGGTPDATPGASDGIFVFGANSQPAGVEVGDSVEVTGEVSEFNGLSEITPGAGGVVELPTPLAPVTPRTVVPGTDCDLPGVGCLAGAALDAAKEAHEGESFQPTGDYTVTDPYDGSAYNGGGFSSSMFGEIGLAGESDQPLVTPTEVEDAQSGDVAGRTAYNNAHRVILDDGSSLNYASSSNTDEPFPWFTPDHTVRVGAAVTFEEPMILDYRFGWKLQPSGGQVVGAPTGRIAFEQDRPALPADVGGDLKLAAFNVLNYFTTLGADLPDSAGCVPFEDREDNPITVDECTEIDNGPRGAWNQASFERQQTKIVDSINKLDADIVTLEEIENSLAVDGHDRDEAVSALVEALNADAGSERWAVVDSPATVPASEDVIRTAFIYNPETVSLVGGSEIFDDPAFNNARDPFAQTFKALEGEDADGFAVIANHFKSKGSGFNDGTGQGNANPDRIAQAQALVTFADDFAADNGVERVFLTGDFNAYSMEDPVQVLEAAGYTSLESTDDPDEETYNFDGMIGSLDHIFANDVAEPEVTGVDIWTTNAYESVYYEYSRFNYNVTQLYDDGPYRASDHNPEIVGIDVPNDAPEPVDTTVSATAPAVVYGTGWNAQVTVAPTTATGQVQVLNGSTVLGSSILVNGKGSVPISGTALPPGTHTLTVRYLGDDSHAASTGTFTVIVTAPPNETTVSTLSVASMVYGTPGSASVTVVGSNPASGSVELREGNTLIGTGQVGANGAVTIVIPGTALSVGAHTLTAKYLGDADSDPSQATAQVQVSKATSSTALSVSPGEAVVGQDRITLRATVTAAGVDPTGSVVFSANGVEIGSAPLSGGAATLRIGPGRSVGAFEITAAYQGDGNVATSSSPAADLRVVKADVRIRTKVVPHRVVVNKTRPRLGIAVGADGQVVTGKVRVAWRGKTRVVTLHGGKALIRLGTWRTTGQKKVRVVYLGSAKANRDTTVVTVNVRPRPRR